MILLQLIIYIHYLVIFSIAFDGTVEVQTSLGVIQGLNVSVNDQTVVQFRGIPYAEPPIGNLRFQKPQPLKPWNGILNATQFGPVCPQILSSRYKKILENTDISEDCLHLYLYIPHCIDNNNLKAVIVYFHGGGFYTKAGTLYDGSVLSLHGDVVVVLFNYRLGMFGFMSTEDEYAKGNYGLWDQIEVLKWIQNHIANFGGDPKKVTVVGHSAGGYSIGLLSLSPITKDLFHRAVCMSGFGTTNRAITHGALNATMMLAKRLSCLNDSVEFKDVSSKDMVDCIRQKSMSDIITATSRVKSTYTKSMSFIMTPAPVIDEEILLDYPRLLLSNVTNEAFQRFISLDYIAGTNDADGGLLRGRITGDDRLSNYTDKGITHKSFCEIVIPRLMEDYLDANVNVSKAICNKYKDESSFINQGIKSVEMYGDMMYASEAERTVRAHSHFSPGRTYQFIFTHKPSFTILTTIPSWITGAYHGDEIPFIFKMHVYDYNKEEIALNEMIMTFMSNFAKFGNVNGNGSDSESSQQFWLEFDITDGYYINFSMDTSIGQHLYHDRMQFWLKTVPDIMSPPNQSQEKDISSSENLLAHFPVYLVVAVCYRLLFVCQ